MDDRRAMRLAGLVEHPGWAELVAQVEEDRESVGRKLARELLSNSTRLGQADVDYKRGLYDGMEGVLEIVSRARKKVEREAKE